MGSLCVPRACESPVRVVFPHHPSWPHPACELLDQDFWLAFLSSLARTACSLQWALFLLLFVCFLNMELSFLVLWNLSGASGSQRAWKALDGAFPGEALGLARSLRWGPSAAISAAVGRSHPERERGWLWGHCRRAGVLESRKPPENWRKMQGVLERSFGRGGHRQLIGGEPGAPPRAARSAGNAALWAQSAGLGLRGAELLNSASDNPRSAKLTREDKRRKKPDPESRKGEGPGEERGSGNFISQSTKAS